MIRMALLCALAAVALAGEAAACTCADLPLDERLDESDAAVVGRIVAERADELRGLTVRVLTVEVDQRVKGEVERTLSIRSPSGTTCDVEARMDEAIGLLLTRAPDGSLNASLCSIVSAGELVTVGGEPRGGPIKVAVGLVILGLVLLWAFLRLRRGARPDLPGRHRGRAPRV